MSDEADFGSYLATVQERDIDLLLMEEFHVSEAFVRFFCNRLGLHDASFEGAWHSVSNIDGETDLLLRARVGSQRFGVLIENKIAAAEQDEQDQRYHLRGVRSQQEGKFDCFVTCICAPQAYLDGLRGDSVYQHRVSYETIANWFGELEGPRHAWRLRIMQEAIRQGRRGYAMVVNVTNSQFFLAYWEYLRQRHPEIVMRKPTPKGSKSNWVILKGINFPKRVQVHHKIDQRVVELGFDGRSVSELLAVRSDWPMGIVPIQKGKTACLSINVPELTMNKTIAEQQEELEQVFVAVYRLLPYAQLFGPS